MASDGVNLEAAKLLVRMEHAMRDDYAAKLRKLMNERRKLRAEISRLSASEQKLKAFVSEWRSKAADYVAEEDDDTNGRDKARADILLMCAARVEAALSSPSSPQDKESVR